MDEFVYVVTKKEDILAAYGTLELLTEFINYSLNPETKEGYSYSEQEVKIAIELYGTYAPVVFTSKYEIKKITVTKLPILIHINKDKQ